MRLKLRAQLLNHEARRYQFILLAFMIVCYLHHMRLRLAECSICGGAGSSSHNQLSSANMDRTAARGLQTALNIVGRLPTALAAFTAALRLGTVTPAGRCSAVRLSQKFRWDSLLSNTGRCYVENSARTLPTTSPAGTLPTIASPVGRHSGVRLSEDFRRDSLSLAEFRRDSQQLRRRYSTSQQCSDGLAPMWLSWEM